MLLTPYIGAISAQIISLIEIVPVQGAGVDTIGERRNGNLAIALKLVYKPQSMAAGCDDRRNERQDGIKKRHRGHKAEGRECRSMDVLKVVKKKKKKERDGVILKLGF
jgi:hypothetical protein